MQSYVRNLIHKSKSLWTGTSLLLFTNKSQVCLAIILKLLINFVYKYVYSKLNLTIMY